MQFVTYQVVQWCGVYVQFVTYQVVQWCGVYVQFVTYQVVQWCGVYHNSVDGEAERVVLAAYSGASPVCHTGSRA